MKKDIDYQWTEHGSELETTYGKFCQKSISGSDNFLSWTFFVFTDYMRPAIRMSAIMGLQVIYIMTHDSIGVGEDGPTHQPVEHLTYKTLLKIGKQKIVRN